MTATNFTHILATDPTDAVTRLVYADWLDENDQADDAARQRKIARTTYTRWDIGQAFDRLLNDQDETLYGVYTTPEMDTITVTFGMGDDWETVARIRKTDIQRVGIMLAEINETPGLVELLGTLADAGIVTFAADAAEIAE